MAPRNAVNLSAIRRYPRESAPMPDPLSLSVRDAAQEIAAGRLTAEALAAACLERIAEREPVVGAWAYLDRDAALAAARAATMPSRRGLAARRAVRRSRTSIDTADMPTGYGSPIYHRLPPELRATRLRRAAARRRRRRCSARR